MLLNFNLWHTDIQVGRGMLAHSCCDLLFDTCITIASYVWRECLHFSKVCLVTSYTKCECLYIIRIIYGNIFSNFCLFSIKVVPVNVSDIKFTSKQPSSSTPPPRKSCQIVPPTESELHEFFETFKLFNTKTCNTENYTTIFKAVHSTSYSGFTPLSYITAI